MTKRSYKQIINKIGKCLFKTALKWSREGAPFTKKALYEEFDSIRGRKKFPTKKATRENAEFVRSLAEQITSERESRHPSDQDPKGSRLAILGDREPAILPGGSIRCRALKRRECLILSAASSQLPKFSGCSETKISYGAPTARTDTWQGEQYSTRCTFRKTDATHSITVHPDWYIRVHKRGLACLHGMLTLDAEPVSFEGYTVYRAVWLRKTKGKHIRSESGYIALGPNGAAHAKTASAAKAILTRRANEARYKRFETRIRNELRAMKVDGYGDVTVSISDSLKAGNCEAGTLEFRDQFFPNRESASVFEILSVGSKNDLAINACLRAIRRAKRNQIAS